MQTFPKELGEFITSERAKYYKDRKDFAKKAGLDPSTVRSIENGDTNSPGLESILLIAKALKISHMKLIAIYEGKDPDNIDDSGITLQYQVTDFVSHLPKRILENAISQADPKLLAEALAQKHGDEKMAEFLEQAKELNQKRNDKKQ